MVTSSLPFHRVATIAYRVLSIHGIRPCLENTRRLSTNFTKSYVNGFSVRSYYTSIPRYGGHSFTKSLSCSNERGRYLKINYPGFEKKESNEDLCLLLRMPGVKIQDVKVCVEVEPNTWLVIKGETHDRVSYEGKILLPDNIYETSSDIKGDMQADGMFKLTIPKLKDKQFVKTSSSFANFIYNLIRFRFIASLTKLLLLRTCLIKGLYSEKIDSFTVYMEVSTADSRLHASVTCGIFGKMMELTREGACVSLNMPELKIEDVKSYFRGDNLIIKGTTNKNNKTHYYITGIRLPESVLRKRNMIKTEMKDGMYKATLPYVTSEINSSHS